MLAYIKGILEIKTNGYIVVETAGIGYKVFMPQSTISKLGNIGDKIQVYTYMRVREDDISLYGFLNKFLVPAGLHHLVYAPFQFSEMGGVATIAGEVYTGAMAIRTAEVAAED